MTDLQTLNDLTNELASEITAPDKAEFTIPDDIDDKEQRDSMNEAFAAKISIYKDTLAPELKANEKLKREHKKQLMGFLCGLIIFESAFLVVSVGFLFMMIFFTQIIKVDVSVIKSMIGFMKYFISAVIVELLAILFFIVRSVFDKTIKDLFANFDK